MFKFLTRPAAALALILATSATLAVAAPEASPEWPQWRGPNRDDVAKETGLLTKWPESGPPLAWKTSGLGGGFSSLAISGGHMMSSWKWSESPLVDGDRLIVTPGAANATLVALDKKTGKEIWRAAVPRLGEQGADGAGYASVVASNGGGVKQYVQLTGRGLVSVRAQDGGFLWGYNRVANDVANIPTPIVKGDYVFASTGYQTGSALLKLSRAGDGIEVLHQEV